MSLSIITGLAALIVPLLFVAATFLFRRRRGASGRRRHSSTRRNEGPNLAAFIRNGGLATFGSAGDRLTIPGDRSDSEDD